jgi:MFS transporter, AAHS family, 4-hydroxybenzoate transporter
MAAEAKTIDVARLIDDRALSATQIITIALCGMVTMLDGADTQSIGIAAPLIAKSLGMKPGEFGPVFSAALFGAMIGALTFGPVADRFGRKRLLVAATAMFGVFTFATAIADSFSSLMIYRFLAGLGLGGATPCFIAMTAEYAPKRSRSTLVALMWSCFALGGMTGGFVNSYIIGHFEWRVIFHVGGFAPLVAAALVALFMPESLRFLTAHGEDSPRIRAILYRMYGDAFDPATRFISQEPRFTGATATQLFREGRTSMTLLLWAPFFMGFGALAVSALWSPTLLTLSGLSPSTAATLMGVYGFGAFVGNAAAGKLLDKFGIAMAPVPGFLLGALAYVAFGYCAGSAWLAGICMFCIGALLGVGISSSIVLASTIYPTAIRSTGAGWAMGAGRLGQVAIPWTVGIVIGWGWGPSRIMFLTAAVAMLGGLFLLLLRWRLGGRRGGGDSTQISHMPAKIAGA